MAKPDNKFKFGAWLPDQPDLDNPGIVEAKNILPVGGQYVPYLPAVVAGGAGLSGVVRQAFIAGGTPSSGNHDYQYVATFGATNKFFTGIQGVTVSLSDVTPGTPPIAYTGVSMAQYNTLVIATTGPSGAAPLAHTVGSGSDFATLTGTFGNAPIAAVVGVIGQFVILGQVGGIPYAVQWSGIDAPTDWPTPNSAAAIAEQSGEQFLKPSGGAVLGITEGDQWGLILQAGSIVRMTYQGGGTVFDFNTIENSPGPLSYRSWVKVGANVYFVGAAGFFMTDGTNIVPIGNGKVDRYFLNKVDDAFLDAVSCGVDYTNKLIYWTLPKPGDSGLPQEMLVFNYVEGKWTHVFDTISAYVQQSAADFELYGTQVWDNGSHFGSLSGTPGTATITTAEMELNPGKRALVTSYTPQITGTTAVTAKIGSRTLQSDSVVFTAAITPDAFTGDCNALVDSRYHRAEVDIVGAFTQAMGGEFDAQPTSAY